MDKKNEATGLFFVEKKSPKEIAQILNVHIQTVRSWLRNNADFKAEKERRKSENKAKLKSYKKNWEKQYRSNNDKTVLKRQHYIDVGVLTFEKF